MQQYEMLQGGARGGYERWGSGDAGGDATRRRLFAAGREVLGGILELFRRGGCCYLAGLQKVS